MYPIPGRNQLKDAIAFTYGNSLSITQKFDPGVGSEGSKEGEERYMTDGTGKDDGHVQVSVMHDEE